MTVLANSFDGGTADSAVTVANSGGVNGDAFDEVDPSASTIAYTTDALHGPLACEVSTLIEDDPTFEWASRVSGVSTWGRAYLKIPSLPPDNINILRHIAGAQTVITVRIGDDGRLGLLYGTGTFAQNGSVSITPGAWVRIEWTVTTGTTTGSVQATLFLDPESTTPDDTLSASNVNTATAAAVTTQRMGMLDSAIWGFVLDSVAFSNEGPIGPLAGGGGQEVTGSASAALGALTATASGTRRVHGTASAALGGLTATASGSSSGTVTGSGTAALGALTAAAAGRRTVHGEAAGQLGALTAAASGVRTVHGAAAAALQFTASASGTTTGNTAGRASAALGALTATAAGQRTVHGTASAPLGALTASASGRRTVHGTAAAPLGTLTASASGTTAGNTTGSAAADLGALTATAVGHRTVHGAAAGHLGGLAATASGHRTVRGSAAATFGFTASASADGITRGTATAALGGLTATASGVRTVHGAGTAALGPLAATATGVRTVVGAAVADLGRLEAAAAGQRRVHGTATAALGALMATSAGVVSGQVTGRAVADLGGLRARASGVVTVAAGRAESGSWYTLLAIGQEAAAEARAEEARPPVACPNDGEPLQAGHDGGLYCPFDGWRPGGTYVGDRW